ncbi:MAG: 16S rRNA (cytosine(967)-C(5))-methyltransferase RsmB [Deltaproteobacteria bacterium]|nr:16S rRNA (cytosine(967)-C(5))-methyltransferase RsmB [Deltaproteobacteria bacterium]
MSEEDGGKKGGGRKGGGRKGGGKRGGGSPRPGRGRPQSRNDATERRRGSGATVARLVAVRVLERVERVHAYADIALHQALARSPLSAADRALATELAYGTLRWRGRIDYLLSQVLDQKLEKLEPLVASTLRLGAYQLLFMDRIPQSAAVDQAVACAHSLGSSRATGLVNAVLRRLARESETLPLPAFEDDPLEHIVHALSLPEWIARRWIDEFGAEEAAALAVASNTTPPVTIRANRRCTTPAALLEELREKFPDAHRCTLAPDGLVLGHGGNPASSPAFLEGRYTVQDEASQLVVCLLDPQPDDRVLDTCAAPGTKATAIAERLGEEGRVLALDRNLKRLGLVDRDARRLGLRGITTLSRDATLPLVDLAASDADADAPQAKDFDRVLVDAPCSGLGTLRRNPDARWRLSAEDPTRLATVQAAILHEASRVLRPGGCLVYSTCTVLREENQEIVAAFLQDHPHFRQVPRSELPESLTPVLEEDGTLRCLPHRVATDGFFAVRLERTQ